MLVINLESEKPFYYFSTVDNDNADVVRFYANSFSNLNVRNTSFKIKVFSEEKEYADEFELSSSNIHRVPNKEFYVDWTVPYDATISRKLKMQLAAEYNNFRTQSKIVEVFLNNTIDVDGETEGREPSVIKQLQKGLEQETRNRIVADEELKQKKLEIIDESKTLNDILNILEVERVGEKTVYFFVGGIDYGNTIISIDFSFDDNSFSYLGFDYSGYFGGSEWEIESSLNLNIRGLIENYDYNHNYIFGSKNDFAKYIPNTNKTLNQIVTEYSLPTGFGSFIFVGENYRGTMIGGLCFYSKRYTGYYDVTVICPDGIMYHDNSVNADVNLKTYLADNLISNSVVDLTGSEVNAIMTNGIFQNCVLNGRIIRLTTTWVTVGYSFEKGVFLPFHYVGNGEYKSTFVNGEDEYIVIVNSPSNTITIKPKIKMYYNNIIIHDNNNKTWYIEGVSTTYAQSGNVQDLQLRFFHSMTIKYYRVDGDSNFHSADTIVVKTTIDNGSGDVTFYLGDGTSFTVTNGTSFTNTVSLIQ